jgi:U1 small nuclear ribonucleoprotein 70kDa
MTALLPPNLLRLFAPRPPTLYLGALGKDVTDRGPNKLKGVSNLVHRIREEADDAEVAGGMEVDGESSKPVEQKKEEKRGKKGKRRAVKMKDDEISRKGVIGQEAVKMRKEERIKRLEANKKIAEENCNVTDIVLMKTDKPQDDENAVGDPYKTLFVSRLSKKTTEADLRREFEVYGVIERIRIVKDKKGKSLSYAFIVYERERDMKGLVHTISLISSGV